MAALTKKAPFKARTESIRLYLQACALPSADCGKARVCTNAECGLAYPVRDDIPVLLVDEARQPGGGS